MTDEEKELALSLSADEITEADFLRILQIGRADVRQLTLRFLEESLATLDPEGVECALNVGFVFGFDTEHLDVLSALSDSEWHFRHEDVVEALSDLQSPRTVDTLFRAALHPHGYLDYDESRSLSIKAIWAISCVATPSAIEALHKLAASDIVRVAEEAKRHLEQAKGDGTL